jgi:hypothetical protein
MCELLGGMLFYPLNTRLAVRLQWFAQTYGIQNYEGILILAGQKYWVKNMPALKAKTLLKN